MEVRAVIKVRFPVAYLDVILWESELESRGEK